MRYRATFLAGIAVGFVIGTRAGRERYEQMKRLAGHVAEHPAVKQATDTVVTSAGEFAKSAGDKAAATMPRIVGTAKSKAGGRLDRIPGRRGARRSEPATNPAGSDSQRFTASRPNPPGHPNGT